MVLVGTRDQLLEKLGAARDRAGRAVAGLVKTTVDAEAKLAFSLDRIKRAERNRDVALLLARVHARSPSVAPRLANRLTPP